MKPCRPFAVLASAALPLGVNSSILIAILVAASPAARADETNWVDRYIEGNGACSQQPTVYQPQPFGLPIREWTDDDLAKLKSAIERCEAKYQNERHISLPWGRAVYDAVVSDVQDMRQYDARDKARREAQKIETQQVEAARRHQTERDRAASEEQERERNARADAAVAEKKASDARAARTLAISQERDRIREEARLAGVREQAQRDRDAAARTKKLAEQEAAQISEIEKQASEARQARIDAERHLEELRQQVTSAQQTRSSEDAAAKATRDERVQIERKVAQNAREKREYEALAKVCSVSSEQFGRVTLGMTLREVRQIFGCVGSLNTTTEIAGVGTFSVYQWDGIKGAALTTFNDDRLVTKSQNALD